MRAHLSTRWLGLGWAALAGAVLWWQVLPHTDTVSVSFPGYWLVARELLSGTPAISLYDPAYLLPRFEAHGFPGDRMFGPPTLALTLAPLAWLPHDTAREAWLIGVLWPLLMASLAWLLWPLRAGGLLLGAAIAMSQPVAANMAVGQTYPLMLALHCMALSGWRRGHAGWSAVGLSPMLALRGWYGLLPAAGWVLRGRPAGLLAAVAGTLVIIAATMPVLGVASWWHFLTVQVPSAGGDAAMVLAYQTWRSFSLHLGTHHPTFSPDPPLPGLGTAMWLGGSLLLGAVSLWAARRAGAREAAFGLWVALSLLLAPVAEDHHMLLTAIPMAILWRQGARAPVLLAGLLLWPAWAYDQPALIGGWRSILGYPRLAGVLVLWAASARACRALP